MLTTKAVLLAVLCCTTLIVASCGDGSGGDIAEVTTTVAGASTAQPGGQSTTELTPESTLATTSTTAARSTATGADSAEKALREVIEAKGLGQTGRAWDLVLPAQRALLSRDSYFSCQDSSSIDVVGVEVIDEYPERISVAGLGEQDSTALTTKVTVSTGGQEYTDTDTYHALKEDGAWYVSVDDENFACAKA